jgi:hypothetical protein
MTVPVAKTTASRALRPGPGREILAGIRTEEERRAAAAPSLTAVAA